MENLIFVFFSFFESSLISLERYCTSLRNSAISFEDFSFSVPKSILAKAAVIYPKIEKA